MAYGARKRTARAVYAPRKGSSGSGDVDPGLSVQPHNPKGSVGDTAIRAEPEDRPVCAPLRDDDDGSAARSGGEDREPALPSDGGGLCAGDDGSSGQHRSSKDFSLPSVEVLKYAQLPDVSYRHWGPPEKAVTRPAPNGVCQGTDVLEDASNGQRLEQLIGKALGKIEEILNLTLPAQTDPNYMKMVSTQKDAAVAVVNMGFKAGDSAMRKKETDILAKLLESMKDDEDELPVISNSPPTIDMLN